MHRLASLDDASRTRLGGAALALGTLLLLVGVIWAHYALFPQTELLTFDGVQPAIGEFVEKDGIRGTVVDVQQDPTNPTIFRATVEVQVDYLGWIPRGWQWVTLGQLVAFGGSQLMLFGAAMLWVANRKMTWTRATFAAFLVWVEMALLFGVVPSEWLNLAQGPLEWGEQRVAFTIPSWLVLGNEVSVSYAVLKDLISAGYNTGMLVAFAVIAYKLQDWGKKPAEETRPVAVSPYGRPIVKGEGS